MRNEYYFLKKELSTLLKTKDVLSFHKDVEVIDRIINLLTEVKTVDKIKGIISTTEITKYGGNISDKEVQKVYTDIIEWWNEKN